MTYPVALPHHRRMYDLGPSITGVLPTVLFDIYAIGQLPSGVLEDHIANRQTLVLSLLTTALVGLLDARYRLLLFVAPGLFGFGAGPYAITRFTALGRVSTDAFGTAVGVTYASSELEPSRLSSIAALVVLPFVDGPRVLVGLTAFLGGFYSYGTPIEFSRVSSLPVEDSFGEKRGVSRLPVVSLSTAVLSARSKARVDPGTAAMPIRSRDRRSKLSRRFGRASDAGLTEDVRLETMDMPPDGERVVRRTRVQGCTAITGRRAAATVGFWF